MKNIIPYHIPVLGAESVELLDVKPAGTYVDLTMGGGGHSRLILSKLGQKGRLIGFDQDEDACANIPDDSRFTFVRGNFRFMRGQLRAIGIESVDGVLADLGVSSHHFDSPERGFSFRFDSPLDMRMNQSAPRSAADIVNNYNVEQLARILRDYGEIDSSRRVASLIVRNRDAAPIQSVGELLAVVEPCTPRKDANKFLSKLFQALRIEVNSEINALEMALEQSLRVLNTGGRMVVISYHSLEDRLVKNFFRSGSFAGEMQKDLYGHSRSPWKIVTRKAAVPSESEVMSNPRSRSAKLRAAEKL